VSAPSAIIQDNDILDESINLDDFSVVVATD